jgi:hypothetical protein
VSAFERIKSFLPETTESFHIESMYANGAVNTQDGYRRGPQGNIVIDTPIKPSRPLNR